MKSILLTKEQQTYYVLRFASAMCFIGHGAFGIITKPIWCNYFAVFGIDHASAYKLMPFAGSADILFGLIILFYPIRAVFMWLVAWGIITAALRPLSGEPFAEFIERAGNFGAPLALLALTATRSNWRPVLQVTDPPSGVSEVNIDRVRITLRIVCFLLLAGHGWLNLVDRQGLIAKYTSLGFHDPQQTAFFAGIAEICMACLILVKPVRPIILLILVWKMSTELFYPHYEAWEWIERGGSYGSLLALFYILAPVKSLRHSQQFHPVHSSEA